LSWFCAFTAEGLHIRSQKYGDIKSWRPDRLAIPELATTPQVLAPLLSSLYASQHEQPVYVLLQNGLGVERDLYHSVKTLGRGEPRILSTVVWIGTNLKGNVVEHNNFDRVTLGVYRHEDHLTTTNKPVEKALLDDFGGMLEKGGTTLTIVPEIQRMKFAKNLWNVAFSSLSTLTDSPLTSIFRPAPSAESGLRYEPYVASVTADRVQENTLASLKGTLGELIALGRAMGYPDNPEGLPSTLINSTIENTGKQHQDPNHKYLPSMLLDVRTNKPIEVEVIFGEIVRMARRWDVPVPRIETLYGLLTVVQNQILGGLRRGQSQ